MKVTVALTSKELERLTERFVVEIEDHEGEFYFVKTTAANIENVFTQVQAAGILAGVA